MKMNVSVLSGQDHKPTLRFGLPQSTALYFQGMESQLNTDDEYRQALKELDQIVSIHSLNESDEDDIEQAMAILRDVQVYSHKMSHVRDVQLSQIEDNISGVRRALNSPPGEVSYSYTSQNINNLATYCGV